MIYSAAAFYSCGAMCRVLDWSTKQLVANACKYSLANIISSSSCI